VSTASINNPKQLVRSIELLTTMHVLEKDRADAGDICPISHMKGSETKDTVYVKRANGPEDCYNKGSLVRWIRSGHTSNPVTRQEIKKQI